MRVTPPNLLRLDRDELLRDVKERLEAFAPGFADALDPTNPAWIVLQEAAWMVESLSEQLDEYPWAVVRQFAHLLGAELRPAVPSVGVLCVQPNQAAPLALGGNPAKWRFFTAQTEDRDLLEYALAETNVPVSPGRVESLARVRDGALSTAGFESPRDPELADNTAFVGELHASKAFRKERFHYELVGTDPDKLLKEVTEALATYKKTRDTGWLRFEATKTDAETVELIATIDPNAAFDGAPQGEPGDVTGPWRALDDSTWTPPVAVADHPVLPPTLRGTQPMRTAEGDLLIPDVPGNMLLDELLERAPRPAPAEIPPAIWKTLAHLDNRLAPLRPTITRRVDVGAGEPTWVDAALRAGAWFRIAERPHQTLAHLTITRTRQIRPVRIGWIVRPGQTRAPRAFALHDQHGMLPQPLPQTAQWTLGLHDPKGRGMVDVVAVDVTVPAGVGELLLTIDGDAEAAMLNPCMVVQAPIVQDGRTVTITRAIPEPTSLLFPDLVTRDVVDRLVASGLAAEAASVLARMPTSFVTAGEERILDFRGIDVDPASGGVVLNAPDARGDLRRFKRGTEIAFRWYRRTSGAVGNVGPGEITFAEQAPSTKPRLEGVSNPLATGWGQAREREDEAVDRIFGPQTGVPVTPADWERQVRGALGKEARDWIVRVWGYAERSLMSHTLWPPHDDGPADPERARLETELASAGPEVLLVAVGPADDVLDLGDLERAQRQVDALVTAWAERIPTIRRAIVTRLWPLSVDGTASAPLPAFSVADLEGHLVDGLGRRLPMPRTRLLLNAAVVKAVT